MCVERTIGNTAILSIKREGTYKHCLDYISGNTNQGNCKRVCIKYFNKEIQQQRDIIKSGKRRKEQKSHQRGPILPPGCQPLYFIVVLGCRLNKTSPSSMSLGSSYTVDIWKSVLAFFTEYEFSFSP